MESEKRVMVFHYGGTTEQFPDLFECNSVGFEHCKNCLLQGMEATFESGFGHYENSQQKLKKSLAASCVFSKAPHNSRI